MKNKSTRLRQPYLARNELAEENKKLLAELEFAYQNMQVILEQANQEKAIAYRELEKKFKSLEHLYGELSNKENLLIHMEKLSSIGQFIAEIIHELKSPISAIAANVELIKFHEPPIELAAFLNEISDQVYRMDEYLNRFRGMVYRGQQDFQVFDLNQNLIECIGTIEIIKPKDIVIDLELCDDLLLVNGDPHQIDQIFLNLAKNAFDAMDLQGNKLILETQVVTAEWAADATNWGKIYCESAKTWENIRAKYKSFAYAAITDNGNGIAEENLSKIFQAFFTTKEPGKGTGLGLSISSDIARRHHGNLAVKSTPGIGTTFQLVLPLIVAEIK